MRQKKIVNGRAAFAAIAILFVSSATCASGADSGELNLVRNPNFTEGGVGWSIPKGSAWKVVSNAGMNAGEGALVWENRDPAHYSFPVQHFTPVPGAVYRFRVLVRTDELTGSRIQVGIETSSKGGKWLGGCYAGPVYDNDVSVKDGWVKYEAVTAPMPADAGRSGLLCAVLKGGTGKVRFGGFRMEMELPDPVSFLLSSRFRNEAHAGDVEFFAGLHVNVAENPLENHRALIAYTAADGSRKTLPPTVFSSERAVFRIKAEELLFGRQDVEFRLMRGDRTLATAKCPFTRMREPAKRHIDIDTARRLLVDGRPFFPLGMYSCPNSEKWLDKYQEAPFNFTTLYGISDKKRLDPFAERGIYVATDVRLLIDEYDKTLQKNAKPKTHAESRAAIRRHVEDLGGHPALLMWYVTDEVPYTLISKVAAANDYFHELDPEHPTFSVQNNPKDAEWYLNCCDVMATDCYPIGNHGRPISAVGEWVRVADEKMGRLRPAWQVPQAMNWKWYFKGKDLEQPDLRFPTREELANMCWQAIAAGANGICMYSFDSMIRGFAGDQPGFDAAWASVVSVAKELRRLEPVIMADPSELRPKGSLPKESFFRAWVSDGREMILFVNATRQPMATELSFDRKFASCAAALGRAPALSSDGCAVRVELPALGATVFALRQ